MLIESLKIVIWPATIGSCFYKLGVLMFSGFGW